MDKKVIWIIVLVIIIVILIAGAGVGTAYYLGKKVISTPTPSSSATPCTNCGKSPSPIEMTSEQVKANHCLKTPNGGTGNITIADLAHYTEVTSPITFTGTANVFEGSFLVRIVDCNGNETINQTTAQAQSGEVGVSNPYLVTITYPVSYIGHYATIEAYDLSAMDGSTQDLIQVPVYLK